MIENVNSENKFKLFFKSIFRFLIPGILLLFLLVLGYFILDPFKVIYTYKDYSKNNYVACNRDYISTETYLTKRNKYHYNSFVFGSSRTLCYSPEKWKSFLGNDAKPFVFDATMESIYGIWKKVKFLDSLDTDMKNVLFIFCRDYTFNNATNPENHLLVKHPILSGESKIDFHLSFLKAYFDFNFLASFYTYQVTRNQMSFMNEYINEKKISFNPITNHLQLDEDEHLLKINPALYYKKNKHKFFFVKDENGMLIDEIIIPTEQTIEDNQQIRVKELKMLKDIHYILKKRNSNYEIILHPLLDKKKFSSKDMTILNQLFKGHVHDFTGKNNYTMSYKNYYDWSHFRPFIGDSILSIIFKK